MKKKLLICTDSHVLHTGLAEVTRLIFKKLLDKYGQFYEIVQLGYFHSNPIMKPMWQIIPTQYDQNPDGSYKFKEADRYGQLTYPNVVKDFKPDIVFGYGDPWYVNHMINHKSIMNHGTVLYLTYDGIPYGDIDQAWLKNVDQLVTCVDFSKQVMTECMPELDPSKIEVIYHPADLTRFGKIPSNEKQKHRKAMAPNIPENAFVMGWAGRNQWRKQVWKPYEILSYIRSGAYYICGDCSEITPIPYNPCTNKYIDTYPGTTTKFEHVCGYCKSENITKAEPLNDVYLWSHMAHEDKHWPVEVLHKQFNLKNGEVIYTPNFSREKGLDPGFMNILYNIWDVSIYLSGGEGFGLPNYESILAETPSIGTDYSAHGEIINKSKGGITVPGVLQPEAGSCIWRIIADTGKTLKAVRHYYFNRDQILIDGRNGRTNLEDQSTDILVDKWHSIFQKVSEPIRKKTFCVFGEKI